MNNTFYYKNINVFNYKVAYIPYYLLKFKILQLPLDLRVWDKRINLSIRRTPHVCVWFVFTYFYV